MAKNVTTVKINESFVGENNSGFYAEDIPGLDLKRGGQWGLLPVIGGEANGKPIHEYMHEQSYHRKDLIAIVLETPKGFDLLPNAKEWKMAIKALFEVHAKTISGLNSTLTVGVENKAMGLSGAEFVEPNDVTRESSSVVLGGISERYGIPFETLLDVWIRYMIKDPDIKAPLINRLVDAFQLPEAWTADYYSCTVLYIEPDTMLRKPVHAWVVSNQFPQAGLEVIGSKDKATPNGNKESEITMGGIALPPTNKKVKELSAKILDALELWTKDPEEILLPADKVEAALANVPDLNIYYEGKK